MSALTDSLGRRKRISPYSTGKRVIPTERALLMMEKLHRHGPLSTPFLVEFAGQKFSSRNRTLERLTDLFNEDNTPHQGRYLDRPHQQFATLDARYHDLMYDVLPPAVEALKDTERFFLNTPETSSLKWKHDAFCAAITASVDLAAAQHPEQYEYIFHDEIVSRIGKFEFPIGSYLLRPDRAFGIRYKPSGQARIFLIEADCATEPLTGPAKRKTQERTLAHYKTFIQDREYHRYFPHGTRLMLLYVFSSKNRMHNVMQMAGNNTYVLFQSWSAFSKYFIPPKPRHDLFTHGWLRAGNSEFFISMI